MYFWFGCISFVFFSNFVSKESANEETSFCIIVKSVANGTRIPLYEIHPLVLKHFIKILSFNGKQVKWNSKDEERKNSWTVGDLINIDSRE